VLLAMMVLAMLRMPTVELKLLIPLKMPPPRDDAELPERVELVRVRVAPALLMMPPPKGAVLPERVELVTVNKLPKLPMPPPELVALLPEIVELETVPVPAKKIPPPMPTAVLSEIVELVTVRLPPLLKMPAADPFVEVFFLMVELVMVRVPELLKAPPLPVICAPETSTPEMERLPPEAMLKILKPPAEPLMVSEEAPRPVMVRVPTVVPVPPVPEAVALASKMVGNAAVKAMVPVMLKSMVSLPGVALASVIACRRDPVPEFAKEVTGKLAGTILPSSCRSCGRE